MFFKLISLGGYGPTMCWRVAWLNSGGCACGSDRNFTFYVLRDSLLAVLDKRYKSYLCQMWLIVDYSSGMDL
jgi:hypothetical protein